MAGGGGADARWLITYGDLVTLLMAIFLAMYGISHADQNKFRQLLTGLGPFDNPAASTSGAAGGGSGVIGGGAPDVVAQRSNSVVGERSTPAVDDPSANGPTDAPRYAGAAELPAIQERLQTVIDRSGLTGRASLKIDARGLVVTISSDNVLFESGRAVISEEGRRIIAAIAPTVASLANPVLIEGHTDDVPLSRGGYTNWNLSTDRAVAIVELLQQVFAIDPRRLSAVGYAEFRPVAANGDARGRAQNRRVELAITVNGTHEEEAREPAAVAVGGEDGHG